MTPVLSSSSFVCKDFKSVLYLTCFSQVHVCVLLFSSNWPSFMYGVIQTSERKEKQKPVKNCVKLRFKALFKQDPKRMDATLFQRTCQNNTLPLLIIDGRWLSVTCLRKALVTILISWHSWWVLSSSCNVDSGLPTWDVGFTSFFRQQINQILLTKIKKNFTSSLPRR